MLGVGSAFAGYRIEGVLGQGGMGTVYLARHPRLPRSVALKLLNREVCTDPELSRRFEREADVVARLEHPAIVGIYDRGADDGHLWIAMQYIRGTDASTWNAAAHPAATAVRLVAETAAALDYAHSRGVLHRDVKPANILIADGDEFRETHAVLTDFGIARLTDANNTKVTATGTFTATLAYGSPEQLSGEVVDHRSDQYSLACTLFAVLAGHPPYASTNPGQVVMGHISKPPPRLTESRPDLPAAVDAVLARAMAKDRDDRFASCTDFVNAVRCALDGGYVAADLARSAPTVHNADSGGQAMPFGPKAPGIAAERNDRRMAGASPHDPRVAALARPIFDPRAAPNGRVPEDPQEPSPSKTAAFTAGIITLIFGLLFGVGFIGSLAVTMSATNSDDGDSPTVIAIFMLLTVLWNSAAMLLLSGRHAGRVLTGICWGIGVAVCATAVIQLATSPITGGDDVAVIAMYVFLFALSGCVLACAAGRATKRWVDYRTMVRMRRYRY
ncbi:serine/threonine-protein kinase [Nocardia carnea]|uniref:non-specific serine/threonine protein kinase n=1 Tax=Nocardia carnea TaxID=37328 RepID=A0ABW7TVB8_9NOCA|nr:serine/threonine-protein kinase [Nocardia carnea]